MTFEPLGFDRGYNRGIGARDVQSQFPTEFTEAFNDSSFAARGWYDEIWDVDTAIQFTGAASIKAIWTSAGQQTPLGGCLNPACGSMRKKFSPTDVVDLTFYYREPTTWTQDNDGHLFYLMTTEDGDFTGPAESSSHGTGYVEKDATRLQLSWQSHLGDDPTHNWVDRFSVSGVLPNGAAQWFKIRARFKFVSPGNDEMHAWVDDVKVITATGLTLRLATMPNQKFDKILYAPFINSPGAQAAGLFNHVDALEVYTTAQPDPSTDTQIYFWPCESLNYQLRGVTQTGSKLFAGTFDTAEQFAGSASLRTTLSNSQGNHGLDPAFDAGFGGWNQLEGTAYDGTTWKCIWYMKIDASFDWGTADRKIKALRFQSQTTGTELVTAFLRHNGILWSGVSEAGTLHGLSYDFTPAGPNDVTNWHKYEYRIKRQSGIGVADGELYLYVDDVLKASNLGNILDDQSNATAAWADAWGAMMSRQFPQFNTEGAGGFIWVDNLSLETPDF